MGGGEQKMPLALGDLVKAPFFIILVVGAVIATIGLTFKSKDQ
jgi:hypothetical protein